METKWRWVEADNIWVSDEVNGVSIKVRLIDSKFLVVYPACNTSEAAKRYPDITNGNLVPKSFGIRDFGKAMRAAEDILDMFAK